jgi:ABC-type transporter Mla subunit MlaD
LLLSGFVYYLYQTALRKGWFIDKIYYQTSLSNATGLSVGDPVMLMGFTVGELTGIEANGPWDPFGVTIYFWVKKPYYGYLWSDSTVKVAAADLLGKRVIEVTKGARGVPTVAETTNRVVVGMLRRDHVSQELQALLDRGIDLNRALDRLNQDAAADREAFYAGIEEAGPYWLDPAESPAITERLERIVGQIEKAAPNFLVLTNQLNQVLYNSARVTANLEQLSSNMVPVTLDLADITEQLRQPGGLGGLALGTNFPSQIASNLARTEHLITNTDSNLNQLTLEIGYTLVNLADITSNLNWQVQQNTNLLSSISDAVTNADHLVQGLKRHWLLRSAFKEKPRRESDEDEFEVLRSPKDAERAR